MKQIRYFLLAAAVTLTAACELKPREEPQPEEPKTVTVSFAAEAALTRTAFSEPEGGHYPALWQAGDKVKLFLNGAEVNPSSDRGVMTANPSDGGKSSAFQITIPNPGKPESVTFGALCPASAFLALDGGTRQISLSIPAEQTSATLSPDPRAMLIWAAAVPYGDFNRAVNLTFRHLTAYGKLSLTGLAGTLSAVEISSDKGLAGVYGYPSQTSSVSGVEPLTPVSPEGRIRIQASDPDAVWFACAPSDLGGGTLEVTATTSEGTVTRSLVLPVDWNLQPGSVASVSLDMSDSPGGSDIFDEEHIVLSFGAISDVHINSTSNTHAQKFISALNQLKVRAAEKDTDGLDAVVVAGDLTDQPQSTQVQIGYFKSLYEQVLDPRKVPMIYTVGNHDANPSYWWTSNTILQAAMMSQVLGSNYFLTDQDQTMRAGYECRDNLIAGYHVLSVTPTGTAPVTYPAETKAWLDSKLQALTQAAPDRFIFLNTHPMIENTCYGSLLGTPMGKAMSSIWNGSDNWATRDLTATLSKYPQVVTFGGHLHFPLNDPRSLWQGDFTSLGCGSTRYMAIENGEYEDMKSATVMNDCEQFSQGWLIQLDASGNLRASALDFYRSAVIGQPYEIPCPQADKSHLSRYGANRPAANQPPVLDADLLQMSTRQVGSLTSTTLQWGKAADDEFVHHYVVTVSKGGAAIVKKKYLADFYLHPQPSDMKETWSVSLGTLAAGEYQVKLEAFDSWDASATVTKSFKIEGPEPIQKGLYADIDFAGGTARDSKGKVTVTNRGATIAQTSVSHAGKSYTVPAMKAGDSKYVECQFNEIGSFDEARAFMSEGFSIETFFVDKAPGSAAHGVFCGTQYGGWGFALRATGVPYFIVGEDTRNKYVSVDAASVSSTSELTHVVCVYDPAAKKMLLYINGVLNASNASLSGSFYPGDPPCFNRFCLGADISGGAPEFPCTDMVITDAKWYVGALDATAVQAAYQAAVKSLNP